MNLWKWLTIKIEYISSLWKPKPKAWSGQQTGKNIINYLDLNLRERTVYCISQLKLVWCNYLYKSINQSINQYITKSWNVAFNAAALTLCHINCHVILFFFSFLKYNLSYNFKMVFTIFSSINVAHYLFIYFHYYPIIYLYN